MDFIKDQWYKYDGCYLQFMGVSKTGKNQFRYAGDDCNIYIDVEDKLKPSSLLPDFSNAKEGDECFSAEDDFCIMLPCHDKHFVPAMNSNGGFDVFLPDGRLTAESKHPTLFNSFAQFLAYWQEEALKLKGGSDA